MNRFDWFILATVGVAFWVFDVMAVGLMDAASSDEYILVVVVGIIVGELNLIGAWGALAPGKVIVRLPWAGLLGVLIWQAIAIGQRAESWHRASESLTAGVSIGFGVVATQVPLWLARRPFRWRLLPPRFRAEDVAEADAQFNLRHLFLGVFLTSIGLALSRFILADATLADFRLDGTLCVLLVTAAACNALVTAPCIWLAFGRARLLAILLPVWILYVAAVSAAELLTLTITLGPPGGGANWILVFTLLNLAQCATVVTVLLLLRGIGFSLLRIPPPAVQCGNPFKAIDGLPGPGNEETQPRRSGKDLRFRDPMAP